MDKRRWPRQWVLTNEDNISLVVRSLVLMSDAQGLDHFVLSVLNIY